MKNKHNTNENVSREALVGRLMKEDQRYSRLSKGIQIVYFILLPLYLILTIIHIIESSSWYEITGSICFTLSMLIFALFFRRYYKEYKYVDYSQPTLIMLKEAAFRYQPFQWRLFWILFALLLMDAGLSLATVQMEHVKLVQIMFLGSIGVSVIIGYALWWGEVPAIKSGRIKTDKRD